MARPRTGNITKKPAGTFETRWFDEHGRRRSKTFQRKRDAQNFLRRELGRVEDVKAGALLGVPKPRTVAELAEAWLTGPGADKRSKQSDESYLRAHLLPAFGARNISDIGPQDIDRFKAERIGRLTKNTINHHLGLLISMLRYAVELEWLVKVPKIQRYKLEEAPYSYLTSDEEIRRFLDAAYEADPRAYQLYVTALYTGLRLGELAGLRAGDIDLDRRIITVRRSYDGPTKSGRIRHVPVLDPLHPILTQITEDLSPEALVFTASAGTMLNRSSHVVRRRLASILAKADFPKGYITFHDLRHTFASHWVMNGGDLFKLQRILGHADTKMTQRYAHLAPHAFVNDLSRLPDIT